jgi:hypothetical protein
MKLFFENITDEIKIPMDFPLDAVFEQAMEVFEQLPEDDGSSFGIVNDQNVMVQFRKYNQFMWLVEIPDHSKHGVHQAICNRGQCIRIIEDLFSGADAMSVTQFKFESYL